MIAIENENTFKKAFADGMNLFVGAGFSLLAEDAEGRPLPTGSQLLEEVKGRFKISAAESLSLPQVCTILEAERKDQLYAFLKERFTVHKFSNKYHVLESLNIKTIFTTNIDNLLFKIFATSQNRYLNDLGTRGPAFTDRAAINYVALHGSIIHEGEALEFTSTNLAAAFSIDPDKWHFLTGQIQKYPTLFWGYSLADAGTLQALNPQTIKGRPQQDKWIALKQPSEGDKRYFRALGFQIIEADSETLLDYLRDNVPAATRSAALKLPTGELFPEFALPPPGSIPVRPLIDFFLGVPPTWADIYSGRIPRTHHFTRVLDTINAGSDAIILGIPASGKTTLMMQLASQIQFQGHKLVCDFITEDKARLILRNLRDEKALVFLDNFADSIDSFNLLAESPNVVAVGFERDLNYEMASHKITSKEIKFIDVSDIDERDTQEIFSVIPSPIRRLKYAAPVMEQGTDPSLYEIIENNITESKLSTRYRKVLQDLEVDDEQLHDLLVMCCYVHSCRTPVSFDMALAFMRGIVGSPEELYEHFSGLKNLIVGYSGEFVDTEQDYFTPRSALFSEAILNQVSHNSLKRVLLRFHNEVSPYRICRFDVFRRRAFDARIMGKAFHNWQEGMEFYEQQYQHDRSPYLRQQGALYLSFKRRFTEAFNWIDEAVLESQYRIPSIRNTHAIILFRANVNAPEGDGTKRNTLDQSMKILADCHKYDRRKTYHAVTFADQAIQYFNLYADANAYGYLATAAKWLRDEKRTNPWNRSVTRLLKEIESRLQ